MNATSATPSTARRVRREPTVAAKPAHEATNTVTGTATRATAAEFAKSRGRSTARAASA